MTKENILQEVKKALNEAKSGELYSNILRLTELQQNLLEDVRHENNKNNNAGKIEKLAKDILKAGTKNGGYKMMGYTHTTPDGLQYALDGHRLIEIYNPLDLPDWNKDGDGDLQKYYDVKKIIPAAYEKYISLTMPDPVELRTFVKANKKENPICKLYTPYDHNEIYINAAWLSLAIDCFTNPVIEMQEDYTDYKSPVYIRGKEGRLLILPININGLQNRYKYIFDSASNTEIKAA